MCNAPICICIPVSQAPHGWLRVTKDQFFAWIGPRDIVYSVRASATSWAALSTVWR